MNRPFDDEEYQAYLDNLDSLLVPGIVKIQEEYLEKAKENFTTELKNYIDSVKEKEKFADKQATDYWNKLNTLLNEKNAFEKEKKEWEKNKNNQIYNFLKEFGLDLKPGQKVWLIAKVEELKKGKK